MHPAEFMGVSQPTYWTSKGAEEGRGWRVVPVNFSEEKALKKALEIGGTLGGRDTRELGSYSGLRLACAWRIEHPGLWGKYGAELWNMRSNDLQVLRESGLDVPRIKIRQAMFDATKNLPGELDPDINEVYLSHGTKPETVLSILSQGCNERFSGGKFGHGTYFAEDVAKNDQYVTRDDRFNSSNDLKDLHDVLYTKSKMKHPGNVFYLFFCRVMLGHAIKTTDNIPSLWSSPERELAWIPRAKRKITYHSLLVELGERIARYREFIVFNGNRIYPEYLVAYQRTS